VDLRRAHGKAQQPGHRFDGAHAIWLDGVKVSPTWGGNSGAVKRQTDHYLFDHVRLSVR
jgi:hypothetical protein